MRIMCVSHEASLTGAPKVLFDLAQLLAQKHEVMVITKFGGPLFDAMSQAPIPGIIACINTNTQYPGCKLPLQDRVAAAQQLIAKLKPDLVYANSAETADWVIAGRLSGIKTIFHLHEMADGINSAIRTGCLPLDIMNYVDTLICVSKDVEADVKRIFPIQAKHGVVLENFFDCDRILAAANVAQPLPQNALAQPLIIGKPTVCGCGLASHRKGIDIFFETAQKLPDIQFIWIGRWDDRPDNPVFHRFSEKKLKNFFLTGEVKNPHFYINLADIFALTSREDPNPLVVFEALILNKQAVCFNKTGGSRFILDRYGYVISGQPNADQLASILRRLMPQNQSVYVPEWLASATQEIRQTYGIKTLFPKFEQLILNSVTRSHPTPIPLIRSR